MSNLYPKIAGPFKRHALGLLRNRVDESSWTRPEFELLAQLGWTWTEKVDGMNVRVLWDGYGVTFGGRTDRAIMPGRLMETLTKLFPEELLEQQFGATPAVLYGEGYGAGIQAGGNYGADQRFALFDAHVDGSWWLLPEQVAELAANLAVTAAPTVLTGSVWDAIERVKNGLTSTWGDFTAEGLVGRPPLGITARSGNRLLMKVKSCDFKEVG